MKPFLVLVLPFLLQLVQSSPGPIVEAMQQQTCNCGNKIEYSRINTNRNASRGEFPWRVRFCKDDAWYNCCAGTIISPRWIVTSARCVDPKKQEMDITIGGNGQIIKSEQVIQNRHFKDKRNQVDARDDIALIQLQEKIRFNENISPICLPYQYKDNKKISGEVEFSGYGYSRTDSGSNTLRKSTLNLMKNEECRDILRTNFGKGLWWDQQICTAPSPHGPCLRDAGGSIDFESGNRWYLLGVASNFGDSCADSTAPGVFARMPFYIHDGWFKDVVGKEKFCGQ